MKTNKPEDIIRKLTLTQLDAIMVILSCKNYTTTSKYIGDHMKRGDGKSLACLIPLTKGDNPLIKRLGKINARSGYVLGFNTEVMSPIEAVKIVDEIIDRLEKAGLAT